MSDQGKYNSKTKKLSDEDHLRIARLREEVIARITEISLIMARTLDVAPPSVIREYVLTDGPAAAPLSMSILKTNGPTDPVTGKVEIVAWGCHCNAKKICCADPDCPPCP